MPTEDVYDESIVDTLFNFPIVIICWENSDQWSPIDTLLASETTCETAVENLQYGSQGPLFNPNVQSKRVLNELNERTELNGILMPWTDIN